MHWSGLLVRPMLWCEQYILYWSMVLQGVQLSLLGKHVYGPNQATDIRLSRGELSLETSVPAGSIWFHSCPN